MKRVLKGIRKKFDKKDKRKGKKPSQSSTSSTPKQNAPKGSISRTQGSVSGASKTTTETAPPRSVGESPPEDQQKLGITYDDFYEELPTFKECLPEEREPLLLKKLKLCCLVFPFNEEAAQNEKIQETTELKRHTLLELVDLISTTKQWFSLAVLKEIINMVSLNLFRTLPQSPLKDFDPEEDEPNLDLAWPHLQIVYEFLLRFVVSTDTDVKLMKEHVTPDFVLQILQLFNSEDPRERDYLKTILHRIYGKFMGLRPFIRKAISNVFYEFIYESNRHNGAGELLEILGSIINGFAHPVKGEHKWFLRNVLIPLHKVEPLALFHRQLAYCVTQYVDKDQTLAPVIIGGLLSFWPVTNSQKEVMFIGELEEILEITQVDEFQKIMDPLFQQLAKCICSTHFQVAERSLFLWNNEYIAGLSIDFRQKVLPMIYPSLRQNETHWNETVRNLTANIIKLFEETDEAFLTECREMDKLDVETKSRHSAIQKEQWSRLAQLAEDKGGAGGGNGSGSNGSASSAASRANETNGAVLLLNGDAGGGGGAAHMNGIANHVGVGESSNHFEETTSNHVGTNGNHHVGTSDSDNERKEDP